MASLFGWRKSPAEVVRLATTSMSKSEASVRKAKGVAVPGSLAQPPVPAAVPQDREEVVKRVGEMKKYVCGEVRRLDAAPLRRQRCSVAPGVRCAGLRRAARSRSQTSAQPSRRR